VIKLKRRSKKRLRLLRLVGRDRRYVKGQKYTLLSRKENLALDGKRALKRLLSANKGAQHGLCSQGEFWPTVEL
jgi:hypothetical protein